MLACDPDLADTAAFCAAYGYELNDSANTIVVASKRPKGEFVACVVLADTRLDVNRKVNTEMGWKKASFAKPEETVELTGMDVGGVTPFALPSGLEILIDSAVAARPSVIVGAGTREAKIQIPPDAMLKLPRARLVEGLAHPAGSVS